MVSIRIGSGLGTTARRPKALRYATLPLAPTRTTAPGHLPSLLASPPSRRQLASHVGRPVESISKNCHLLVTGFLLVILAGFVAESLEGSDKARNLSPPFDSRWPVTVYWPPPPRRIISRPSY